MIFSLEWFTRRVIICGFFIACRNYGFKNVIPGIINELRNRITKKCAQALKNFKVIFMLE